MPDHPPVLRTAISPPDRVSIPLTPAEIADRAAALAEAARLDAEATAALDGVKTLADVQRSFDLSSRAGHIRLEIENDNRARLAAGYRSSPAGTATVYRHGERSYSLDATTLVTVPDAADDVLTAFAEAGRSLTTGEIVDMSGRPNAARVMQEIERLLPGSVRFPGKGGKGAGYFVRVLPVTER